STSEHADVRDGPGAPGAIATCADSRKREPYRGLGILARDSHRRISRGREPDRRAARTLRDEVRDSAPSGSCRATSRPAAMRRWRSPGTRNKLGRMGSLLTTKPQVVGLPEVWTRAAEEASDLSEWSSLVGDLAVRADAEPEWNVHDRTHLEFAVDYHVDSSDRRSEHRWDAYFFIPESLNLNNRTYREDEIYKDLRSYVRFAAPQSTLDELHATALPILERALRSPDRDEAVHEMRFFACQFRASGLAARRSLSTRIRASANRDRVAAS